MPGNDRPSASAAASRKRFPWLPIAAIVFLVATEAALQWSRQLRSEPLVRLNLPAAPMGTRFGSSEVDIKFGRASRPATLQVLLRWYRPGSAPRETDVTDQFIARENGAVGTLSGLLEGKYVIRARVFGEARRNKDLLVEEVSELDFTVPPLPPLDLTRRLSGCAPRPT